MQNETTIPTVSDRIAQEVVRARLEHELEPLLHENSYGYRPGKSAIDAVANCRQNNWDYDWVLDVDIQQFFDTIDHELLMKAVRKHCSERWMVLYIERWLKAPIQHIDGRCEKAERGTPQGGVISPLLANLYLHYAFDMWMVRTNPKVKFERYADDIIIHCNTSKRARKLRRALERRFAECGLTLHPEKTRVVYCKDSARWQTYPRISFTFLGYTFCPRRMLNAKGEYYCRFLPAASREAQTNLRRRVRQLKVRRRTMLSVTELAGLLNPTIRGWFGYFKHFYASALSHLRYHIEGQLLRWAMNKYRLSIRKAVRLLSGLKARQPRLFAHWHLTA